MNVTTPSSALILSLKHWLSDDDLIVGFTTRQKVSQLIVQGSMTNDEAKAFYRSCRSFWKAALTYSRARLPLKDDLVRNACWIHVQNRLNARFSQVEYVVDRFPFLHDLEVPQEADKLQEEFVEYQTYAFPSDLAEEKSDVKLWLHLGQLKTASGLMRFSRLYRVAKAILVIPHSNAQEEGLFSMIRKNLLGGTTPKPPAGGGRPPPAPTPSTAFGRVRRLRRRFSRLGQFKSWKVCPSTASANDLYPQPTSARLESAGQFVLTDCKFF